MLTATRRIRCSAVNNVRARCLTRGRPSLHESGRHAGLRRLFQGRAGTQAAGTGQGLLAGRETGCGCGAFPAAALVSGPARRSLSHDSSTASGANRAPILWMTNSARMVSCSGLQPSRPAEETVQTGVRGLLVSSPHPQRRVVPSGIAGAGQRPHDLQRLHRSLAEPPGFERLRRFLEVRERQEGCTMTAGYLGTRCRGTRYPARSAQ